MDLSHVPSYMCTCSKQHVLAITIYKASKYFVLSAKGLEKKRWNPIVLVLVNLQSIMPVGKCIAPYDKS